MRGPVANSLHSRLGKRTVDTRLAELHPTDDLGHGKPVCSQLLDFLHDLSGQDRLRTEPHPLSLGLVDPVLLALSADVVLKLRNQGEDDSTMHWQQLTRAADGAFSSCVMLASVVIASGDF